ncbi:MAG: hypothetical protein J5725_10370 [Bacteroidales bacterium]|nr:hypothetical protein [Bacteroidales bacterium]
MDMFNTGFVYVLDGDETFTDAGELAQYITDSLDEEPYESMLNECYEEIEIFGLFYSPAEVLRKVDPVAYRCGMSDYYDGLWSDIKYTIERMGDGDTEEFFGFTVEAMEDGKEEGDEEEEE